MAFSWNKVDFLGATHLREDLSFLSVQHLTTVNSSVTRGGTPCPLPSPCCDLVCAGLVQILCMWLQPLQVHMCSSLLCSEATFLAPIHDLWLLHFLYHLSQWSLSPWRGVCNAYVPLRARDSAAVSKLYTLAYRGFYVHRLLKEKLLSWGLRESLTYKYNDKSLEIGLILYPLSRKIVVDYLLKYMIYLAIIASRTYGYTDNRL